MQEVAERITSFIKPSLCCILVLLTLTFISCTTIKETAQEQAANYRLKIQKELINAENFQFIPLSKPTKSTFFNDTTPALQDYRNRLLRNADWAQIQTWHNAYFLQTPQNKVAISLFIPSTKVKGTVLLIHGYLGHTLNLAYPITEFLKNNWAVLSLDLPGHGMSDGKPSDIQDFSQYGDAVEACNDWLDQHADVFPRPRIIVAHSLGCAASVDYMLRGPSKPPERIFFASPLIRSNYYLASSMLYSISWPFISSLPPMFGWDDYLGGQNIQVHWFSALEKWNTQITKTKRVFPVKGIIFQSTEDIVVDKEFNISFMHKHFPKMKLIQIPGKDHNLLVSQEHRQEVMKKILDF